MITSFPREHRPHIEILRVRDRSDGRWFYVFDLVGLDEDGPYRIDMAHRYYLKEIVEEIQEWRTQGIEVDDREVIL